MPDNINTFVDLFGGGFNVGINVNAKRVIYNDLCEQVSKLLLKLYQTPTEDCLKEIDLLINEYQLTKENQEGFSKLREYYNSENKNPLVFYTLICYAFNNQIRFNSKGSYNMPFGKDRSSFNPSLREKFITFVDGLHNKTCKFASRDFTDLKINKLTSNDFVYCDPPYLNTTAAYNENGGWTEQKEQCIRDMLVDASSNGIRFGLSNNATTNTTLISWAELNGFTVYHLNINYSNCNYQKKDTGKKDDEVYITNYIKT